MILLFGGPFATDVTANFRELPHEERRHVAGRKSSTSALVTVEGQRAAVNLVRSQLSVPREATASLSEIAYAVLAGATENSVVVADPRARRRAAVVDADLVTDGYWDRLERKLSDEAIPPDDEGPDPDPLF